MRTGNLICVNLRNLRMKEVVGAYNTLLGTTPSDVSTNLVFDAICIQSEPVTSDLVTGSGFVYNPSGMPIGADDHFKIAIPDSTVPESDITWTVTEGASNVSFVNDYNTGTNIAIHADSVGDFTMEADVKGLVITPPNVRPCFSGQVLPAVTVPTSVFIVRDTDNNPIREPSTILGLLTEANTILRQRGITLVQSGESHILNNTNWLNHTDLFNPANTNLINMLNTTNSAGNAVELYFVDTLEGGSALGVRLYEGIVIASDGDTVTIAHEVLHSCGTADIYTMEGQNSGDPIPGFVSQDRIPSDWGGGYYAPDLTQRNLVGRLIMRSGGIIEIDTAFPRDLPTGTVWGWRHSTPTDPSSLITLGPAGVGQSSIQNNPRIF